MFTVNCTTTAAQRLLCLRLFCSDEQRLFQQRKATSCQSVHQASTSVSSQSPFLCKERQGSVLIRAGKGNKARSIPLNGSVRTALAEYVAPQFDCEPTPKAVAAVWAQLPQTQPLWVSQKGTALSASAIWRMFIGLVADCSARGLLPAATKPHDLRHTFAHRYLERHPSDLIGLARILGHESLETTKVYLRLSQADLAERIEVIGLNAYE